ncbi:MAG: histidine phosphatase family protein [Oscillospiraceae bacterium]|nr:histidine phosphatase family protein [Oscillospiraceae bacterium]
MRQVHLIRHARTEANDSYRYCGWTDLELSRRGREELSELIANKKYPPLAKNVFTSGLKRTEQTLEMIYGEVEHCIEPDLKEMHFGDFEMHTYEELLSDERYIEWISGDNEANVCPGGESGNIMTKRALRAFERILKECEGDVTIVTHGGVIAAIMAELFPNEKNRFEWQPKNGTGYTLVFNEGCSYKQIP